MQKVKQFAPLQKQMIRCFASITGSELDSVIEKGNGFASAVGQASASDISSSSDSKWMGSYVSVLNQAACEENFNAEAQSEAVNEYFRKNFRKLSVQ